MNKYTNAEIEFLKEHYPKTYKSLILEKLPNHSWSSIKEKCKKIGLSRPKIRTFKLLKLLDLNPINLYWWGFIMADGHITNKGDLKVFLGIADKAHLSKLGRYLDVPIYDYGSMSHLSVCDKINCLNLKHKLDIDHQKTYNPPKHFNYLNDELAMLCFLIGFIDGDGSIQYRKQSFQSIRITVHENWFDFFQLFSTTLQNKSRIKLTITKNGRNNTCALICGCENYKYLLSVIEQNNLPALERKWRI